jgi:carbon monoxide dehydrogenase subunit G
MRLRSEITISAPRDRAWRALGDVETLSGATEVDRGGSPVQWVGSLRALDVDEDAGVATLRMHSREAHGPGLAIGTVEGRVTDAAGGSCIVLEGDVRLTGERGSPKEAQAAGDRLLATLAQQLEQRIIEPEATRAPAAADAPAPPRPQAPSVPPAAGVPVVSSGSVPRLLRTLGPPAAAAAVVIAVGALLGRAPQRRHRARLIVRR